LPTVTRLGALIEEFHLHLSNYNPKVKVVPQSCFFGWFFNLIFFKKNHSPSHYNQAIINLTKVIILQLLIFSTYLTQTDMYEENKYQIN